MEGYAKIADIFFRRRIDYDVDETTVVMAVAGFIIIRFTKRERETPVQMSRLYRTGERSGICCKKMVAE